MIVPDLNLLIYAHNEAAPGHDAARNWWESLLRGSERIGVPWMVVCGFLRLTTQRRFYEGPLTPEYATATVSDWFAVTSVMPLNPGAQHWAILRRLLVDVGVGGNLVTDAHIAALAIEHQAEVHSNDSDFARFSGLRWRNPLLEGR
ncbi:MAG: type II toxin-antitoxin system VapC family toxin [Acidimicrobiales bacterium]|nr:type II toxin-antitoxin system VapC family toxin [Acidimicrobiaceae bacterium]MXV88065.1 type II toxin-antitoxin system VapC family toxin [Acidimicrobiales bacterium]MXX42190.1 type II toxin-antitoxin system VapC family toxin [Acidimicrobiales bacterium]MXZ14447.1 type II toxin-antitoxin system VapC family toxin [Acidimicrobiales bacterium]MYB82705.1 type II toxin-antitoxin system VapC family toxin [Acidimicrobiales bacterium]